MPCPRRIQDQGYLAWGHVSSRPAGREALGWGVRLTSSPGLGEDLSLHTWPQTAPRNNVLAKTASPPAPACATSLTHSHLTLQTVQVILGLQRESVLLPPSFLHTQGISPARS